MRRVQWLVAVAACTGGRTPVAVPDAGVAGDAALECAPPCDGPCDEVRDADRDGYEAGPGGDCDDAVATTHPGAPDGIGWAIEVAPYPPWSVLLVDGAGAPTIASGDVRDDSCSTNVPQYYGIAYLGVVVHERRGVEWTSDVVDDSCILMGPAAAMGDDGEIALAFVLPEELVERSGWRIRVARGRPGEWRFDELDAAEPPVALARRGCDAAVVASSTCHPFLQCETRAHSPIDADSTLIWEASDQFGALGTALDTHGRAYVSYYTHVQGSTGDLMVALEDGQGWSPEVVETLCNGCVVFGSEPAVAGGAAHVAYLTGSGLTVADRDATGAWTPILVDDASPVVNGDWWYSTRVSMKADAEGHLHVAYVVEDQPVRGQYELRYATDRSGDWVIEPVGWPMTNPSPGVVGYPSLALDQQGVVHLGWYSAAEVGSPFEGQDPGRYAVLARPNDGIDQNCDGVDGVDADGDGHASVDSGGDDPDDSAPSQ